MNYAASVRCTYGPPIRTSVTSMKLHAKSLRFDTFAKTSRTRTCCCSSPPWFVVVQSEVQQVEAASHPEAIIELYQARFAMVVYNQHLAHKSVRC